MVKYNKTKKAGKGKKSKMGKNRTKYTARKTKKYKPKKCGCKLPRFFGGKSKKYKNKKRLTRKNLKGGSGLAGLLPSDISNMGRSIMYTFDKNTAISGGHDLPTNPSPVVQNELNKH